MSRIRVLVVGWLLVVGASYYPAGGTSQHSEGGLIRSGVDTISSSLWSPGMDLVTGTGCYDSTGATCFSHFGLPYSYNEHLYCLGVVSRFKDMGKMNLDSIKWAPADSLLQNQLPIPGLSDGYAFAIAQDSLGKCIGNVYVLKTLRDPRRGYPLYAKIRILDFVVRDAASHVVTMKFVWACQLNGEGDLATTGLDTFRLDSGVVRGVPAPRTRVATANAGCGARPVLRAAGNGVVVSGRHGTWDLKGRSRVRPAGK